MSGQTSLRTLLVGVDGACFPVLDPLLSAGDLPALAGVLDGGAAGPLESSIPPWTPSAWPTLFTGTNPGKHGVFDFLAFDGYDWSVVDATRLAARPLWEHLDNHGLSSVVVNVPVTAPPAPFDGALIPGYTAPEDPPCHPPGLLADVRNATGDYRVYRDDGDPVEAFRRQVRARGAAFRYLVERFDPDFGFLQFQSTDTVVHDCPGDEDALGAVYRAVDAELDAVLDAVDPATVVVASDHGVGPYGGHEFRVNEFLRREGYVETRRGGAGMPTWATAREQSLKRGESRDTGRGLAARAAAAAARVGVTAQRVERVLAAAGLADAVARHVPTDAVRAGAEQVDFPASRAYARSRTELGVRVNLAGREPSGTVAEEEYESVREALVADLAAATTPDGDPVFDDVAPREAYFHGPVADRGPDVVTVPAGFDQFLSTRLADDVFGRPAEPWNHKLTGVVALAGDGVDAGADVAGARLVDVAPTVLATLGVPADERMDGEVLPAVDSAGERTYPAYRPPSGRDAVAGDPVEDRLEDLGYIE